ncbi:MAG TPA: M28 family peptidase [Gemmatirosa sp.]|nr:M28 family peptidase [Gemmatirosa sp.]
MPHASLPLRALVLAAALVAAAIALERPARAQLPALPRPPRLGAPSAAASQPVMLDSARLLGDLGVLAADSMEGRGFGTPGGARARRFLAAAFGEVGLVPLAPAGASVPAYVHPFQAPGAWWQRLVGRTREGANVVGMVRGTRVPDRVLVVTAHYDHLGREGETIWRGSDDNASGTAALLAIGRSLVARPPEHTVLLVATDAEERGMHGARALVDAPPVPRSSIALDVNLDMLSRSEGNELWAAGTSRWPRLRAPLEQVAAEAPVRLRLGHDDANGPRTDDWTTQSDHVAFHEAGIPFVYLGVEDHPDYHRPSDTAARADTAFYVNAARTALLVVRRLDAQLDRVAPRPVAARGARAGGPR